jgi:hypothetical protein
VKWTRKAKLKTAKDDLDFVHRNHGAVALGGGAGEIGLSPSQPIHTMMTSILQPGEKIHVIHRRRFEKDIRRHFVGTVEACENGVVRASGYVFVIDDLNQHLFTKRPDLRVKLVPLASGDVIVNVLPMALDIERVNYQLDGRRLWVTDGNGWKMDVKEFGWG